MKRALVFVLLFFPLVSLRAQSIPTEVTGGDAYERAVPIPAGQDLKLSHYQGRGRYDYFVIDLQAGQALVLSLTTGEKGIEVRPDNTFVETAMPYAGIEVHDGQRNKLTQLDLAGERNRQKTLEIDASTPQRLYLLVGSAVQGMHKDQASFKAEVRSNFDAGTDRDAGGTVETALPLQKGRVYPENYLTKNDDADFFRISTSRGEAVSIALQGNNPKTSLNAALYDELRTELTQGRSPAPGAGFQVNATATGTTTTLKVSRNLSDEATQYSMAVQPFVRETAPVVAAETRPVSPTAEPMTPSEPVVRKEHSRSQAVKTVPFRWTEKRILKRLVAASGAGLLVGLVVGFILGRKT